MTSRRWYAQCCKAWSSPASDVLWREMSYSRILLKLRRAITNFYVCTLSIPPPLNSITDYYVEDRQLGSRVCIQKVKYGPTGDTEPWRQFIDQLVSNQPSSICLFPGMRDLSVTERFGLPIVSSFIGLSHCHKASTFIAARLALRKSHHCYGNLVPCTCDGAISSTYIAH